MREWGDEEGIFWQDEIAVSVGKSSKGERKPAQRQFRTAPAPTDYRLPEAYPDIARAKRVTLDLETYDPDLKELGPGSHRDGYVVGAAIRTDDGFREYYPLRHENGPNIDEGQFWQWWNDQCRNYDGELRGSNLLYDIEYSEANGVKFSRKIKYRDNQYAEPLLDENAFTYNLQRLATKYLGEGKKKEDLTRLYGKDYIWYMHRVHPGHAKPYALGDVDLADEVLDAQMPCLEKEGLSQLFDMECRLIPLLAQMRREGVAVDVAAAERFQVTLEEKHRDAMKKLKYIAGFDVNVNAADSIARAFDKLGMPYPRTEPTRKKPTGSPSFRQEWLEHHPSEFAHLINAARKFKKFQGTFIEGYILNSHINGRIYGQFHPLRNDSYGTVSGRFSSSNPNLQNIPIRDDELGPLVRALFLPNAGCQWWSKDYSQIEYRLLVHYASLARCIGADVAVRMYQNDPETDFHQMVAELTGLPRKIAKNINFGFVYGMGAPLLAAHLGMSPKEAEPILNQYHSLVPFARAVYKMAQRKATTAGQIRTILNRIRRFVFWEPRNNFDDRKPAYMRERALQEYGERIQRAFTHKALNSVLQGSAADLIKLAMVQALDEGIFDYLPLHLQVHDELDGSLPEGAIYMEAYERLTELMANAITLKVPVLVSSDIGLNWGAAH